MSEFGGIEPAFIKFTAMSSLHHVAFKSVWVFFKQQ